MGVTDWFRKPREVEREQPQLALNDWIEMLTSFQFQGLNYTLPNAQQEEIGHGFSSLTRSAYKGNGVVFAVMLARMSLFAEARFQFRRIRNGRPAEYFGTEALGILERPWPGGTTADLLARMIQYVDLAGNAFVARRGDRLTVLRPDWTWIIGGTNGDADDPSIWDVDAEVLAYGYQPGGPGSGRDPVYFLADEVAHFAPIPDPEARFRGMSWLTPIVREIMSDKAATDHKLAFFENGATPQLVVKLDVPDLEKFSQWIAKFKEQHDGVANAYKTLYLGAGADATVVGADLQQLDFKVVQGAGETRIAAAGGVPPVIVGLSEGLAAATYSNYRQACRRFADGTMSYLWNNAANSLERIVSPPGGSELSHDPRHIPFLQEDQKDAAEVAQLKATAMKTLIDAGYDPDSVRDAVDANDLTMLTHTGLVSVQLQPPGTTPPDPEPVGPTNGAGRSIDEMFAALLAAREA